MSDKETSDGITRPLVDYSALDRVYSEMAAEIDYATPGRIQGEYIIADHPPEHVLDTLRLWLNFE